MSEEAFDEETTKGFLSLFLLLLLIIVGVLIALSYLNSKYAIVSNLF